uniref:F-box protein AT5G49610-like beta-propeller domain-containing protein n=1 Tax=Arundo donax TaxID=35708 RepID=A0A0A9DR64_ARUDO
MVVLPPRPPKYDRIWCFLPEEGGDGDAVRVGMLPLGTGLQVDLLTLQSGVWVVRLTAALNPPETLPKFRGMLPPVRGKIFMLTNSLKILRLDFAAANISVIQLPDRVRTANFKFSRGEDVFLVHAEGHLLSMWRLATNGNDTNDWVLVYDNIHVREACDRTENVMVIAVDDTAEFVFLGLEASGVVICMHLRSGVEKVEQVSEMTIPQYMSFVRITPFKMVWPPTFPALY